MSFCYVSAKYSYTAQSSQELDLAKGQKYLLLDDSKHWWRVQNARGASGYVPSNYVKREGAGKHLNNENSCGGGSGRGGGGLFDSIKKKVSKATSSSSGSKTLPSSPTHMPNNFNNGNGTFKQLHQLPHQPQHLPQQLPLPHLGSALVKYTYTAQQLDEINLSKGSKVLILEKSNDGWWKGKNSNGQIGWFPSNYTKDDTGDTGADDFEGQQLGQQNTYSTAEAGCVLDIMVGLYDFKGENPTELSFCKSDRLEILSRPTSDPDWYKARNSSGAVGLVPRNYLQELSDFLTQPLLIKNGFHITKEQQNLNQRDIVDSSSRLDQFPWFFGKIGRSECDAFLNEKAVDGDFLVRESETNAGDFSISLKAPGRNKHFRVHVEGEFLCIGQRKFQALEQLVEHYQRAPIYTNTRGEKLYLVRGVLKQ